MTDGSEVPETSRDRLSHRPIPRHPNAAVLFLRSLAFTLGMLPATLLFGTLAPFTFPLPFNARYRFITSWTRFNLWWLGCTCRLHYTVEGADNLPQGGSAVILSKHQSAWETIAFQSIFPPQVWVIKRELLWLPFFGWGLAMLEPIAIDRKAGRRAREQLVEQGRRHLQAGRWVVVFPEGTRVAAGSKGRYGIGGALLASKTGRPVVPVAHNAGEFWPRRSFIKRPGTVRLVIGPAIDSRGLRAKEINRLAEHWIEDTCHAISSVPEQTGNPDK